MDYAVFIAMMLGLIAGFIWGKTNSKVWFYIRLGLAYLETQLRIYRDKRKAKREVPK